LDRPNKTSDVKKATRQYDRISLQALLLIVALNSGPVYAAAPTQEQSLTNVMFVAFDLETTGFSARSDCIVEIGVVRFRNGEVLDSKSWLVNPGISIPESAQRVHGITQTMVAGSSSFPEVFDQFARFIKGAVLLAHNARFDVSFITAEAERNDLTLPDNIVLDTRGLARAWFPEARSYRLEALIKHLNIRESPVDTGKEGRRETQTFHRALADSRHVAALFINQVAKLPPDATFEDLVRAAGGTITFKRRPSRDS